MGGEVLGADSAKSLDLIKSYSWPVAVKDFLCEVAVLRNWWLVVEDLQKLYWHGFGLFSSFSRKRSLNILLGVLRKLIGLKFCLVLEVSEGKWLGLSSFIITSIASSMVWVGVWGRRRLLFRKYVLGSVLLQWCDMFWRLLIWVFM